MFPPPPVYNPAQNAYAMKDFKPLQPGHSRAATTSMAERSSYNPKEHGLIDLHPSGDDMDESGFDTRERTRMVKQSSGRRHHGTAHQQSSAVRGTGGAIGQQGKGGTQFAFTFSVQANDAKSQGFTCTPLDQSGLLDALQDVPRTYRPLPPPPSPKMADKKPALFWDGCKEPYSAGIKRKSTLDEPTTSTGARDDPTDGPNKRYKLNGTANHNKYSLPTDGNTGHATITNGPRRPKNYVWGTSFLRRGLRAASACIFGKPTNNPNSLSFDDKHSTHVVQSRDTDMADL